ncbi:MAG: hypothetical protein AAGD32_13665 [Planctomycetota bacterium]
MPTTNDTPAVVEALDKRLRSLHRRGHFKALTKLIRDRMEHGTLPERFTVASYVEAVVVLPDNLQVHVTPHPTAADAAEK